jgi:hypothetical protein
MSSPVVERVLPKTYGIEINHVYSESTVSHRARESRTNVDEDGCRRISAVDTLATKGSVYRVGQITPRQGPYIPLTAAADSVTFNVYATSMTTIEFPDEPGATLLGSAVAGVDKSRPKADLKLFVELVFGDVEVVGRVYNEASGGSPVSSVHFTYY